MKKSKFVTAELIEMKLRELGLCKGMFIEVHSSLKSFGDVVGGANTVVEVLKKIITTDGAIIMSAFPVTKPLPLSNDDICKGLTFKIKYLNPDSEEPTGMGIIADTFKRSAGVQVGKGIHRVAAWGNEIKKNIEGYTNLHNHDGYGLLLGVDIYSLTSMHYVETNIPEEITNIFKPSEELLKIYPENEWCIMAGNPPEKAWYKIQDEAYRKGLIKDIIIGNAKCMFFKVNSVINLYKHALETNPLKLYGIRKKF
jgi:aminoglycoside N3'-acetyltransferase